MALWSRVGGTLKESGKAEVTGSVTGLVWAGPETLYCSTSSGGLTSYRAAAGDGIQYQMAWPALHKPGSGGCTGVAVHGDSVATVGQDGRINLVAAGQREPVKVYDKADSCSLTALAFSRASELVTANMRGQLKSWDLRSNTRTPTSTAAHSAGITCLSRHPTQAHILVSGGSDGVLGVWDLRNSSHPATLLTAHQAPLSEVVFHPSQPDHLFTCSQGGDVCHWNGASIRLLPSTFRLMLKQTSSVLEIITSMDNNFVQEVRNPRFKGR